MPPLWIVTTLSIASGAAALIYEIVWFQLLQFVIGSSAVSLAVLLTTFMGGMCLGSLLVPRLIPPAYHPLRIYAALEGAVGAIALLMPLLMPWVGSIYLSYVGRGTAGLLLRGVAVTVCLLPPAVLMGATLPVLSRLVTPTRSGVAWTGIVYGSNFVGAVIGCLTASFYLLRFFDLRAATYCAAAVNGGIAVLAVIAAVRVSPESRVSVRMPEPPPASSPAWSIYVVSALSGMAALGAEVVWTRLLSLILGATVYAFSIILAVFLFGLGVGSTAGAVLARRVERPRMALGMCQLLLAGAVAWAAWMLANVLPYWPINPAMALSPWPLFHLDLTRSAWAIFPAAVLWGASFPLALAAVAAPGQEPGRLVGSLYAANTLGAILGGGVGSLVALGAWGSRGAQQGLIILSALAAAIAFAPHVLSTFRGAHHLHTRARRGLVAAAVGSAVLGLIVSVPPVPGMLVAYGRYMAAGFGPADVLYVGEGLNASVAVTELSTGIRNFHVSGKIEASSQPSDMRLQLMLAHLPALLHPAPASVLVVGCGAGVTAGSFALYPEVQRIAIAEIEPLIPTVVATYFSDQNQNVLADPRTEVVYDDARHYLATTDEQFDVITSDPVHPWVRGSAALYTREYFETIRKRLKPGGIVTQWIPLYESDVEVVRSELATFFEVFPNAIVWANLQGGRGYDVVLLGRMAPAPIDVTSLSLRLVDPRHARAAQALRAVGFPELLDLVETYAGRASDLAPWVRGAEVNTDRNLRLQYLAGLQADRYDSDVIYGDFARYRRYPADLFVGDRSALEALRSRIVPAR